MAIMRTCCCCAVRGGSVASAIYSMIIAGLGMLLYAFGLINLDANKKALYTIKMEFPEALGELDIDGYYGALTAEYAFALIFLAFVFFTSIFVFIGITQDCKGLLVPFVVSKCVGFLWYIFAIVLSIYAVVAIGTDYAGYVIIVELVVLIPFFIGDMVCVMCVLSQYQEYRDGRGRASDNVAVQRTVIIAQQMPVASGGFGYQPMQNPPPAYKPTPGPV